MKILKFIDISKGSDIIIGRLIIGHVYKDSWQWEGECSFHWKPYIHIVDFRDEQFWAHYYGGEYMITLYWMGFEWRFGYLPKKGSADHIYKEIKDRNAMRLIEEQQNSGNLY